MRPITWFVIGRITLEIWLSLNPAQRIELIGVAAQNFCEKMQCRKALIRADQMEKEIIISAECFEMEV